MPLPRLFFQRRVEERSLIISHGTSECIAICCRDFDGIYGLSAPDRACGDADTFDSDHELFV